MQMKKLASLLSLPQFTTLEFILISFFLFLAYILGWDEVVCMINGSLSSYIFGLGLCLMCADLGLFFKPLPNTIFSQFTALMMMLSAAIMGGIGSLMGGLFILLIVALVWSTFSLREEQTKKILTSIFGILAVACLICAFTGIDMDVSDSSNDPNRYNDNPNCIWLVTMQVEEMPRVTTDHKIFKMTGTYDEVETYVKELVREQMTTPVYILQRENRHYGYGEYSIGLYQAPLEDIKRNGDYQEWKHYKQMENLKKYGSIKKF